ncbi:uncharacterized protein LOC112906385 isoform X2 [Agrilus planipennis]|uniref:Uncharacterized protein LOC112906385 isoform X2 n=1 Tax=Agrilus planipennis TaxID=224129 RepID=A0A7F5RJN2_AGRPL|nr:uncharacterized protein LOC112906385 isoform X2 [Agrilus planipennis]
MELDFDFESPNDVEPDFGYDMTNDDGPDFECDMINDDGPDFECDMINDDGPDFECDMINDDGPDFECDMTNDDGPDPDLGLDMVKDGGNKKSIGVGSSKYATPITKHSSVKSAKSSTHEEELKNIGVRSSKNAMPKKKHPSIKSAKPSSHKEELQQCVAKNKYATFNDIFNKNGSASLVAGIHINPKNKQTFSVEKFLNTFLSSEENEDRTIEELMQVVQYVGFNPSKTNEEFSKIKVGNELGNKAFLIYLFLTRGSNIDLIRNTSDRRTSEKLTKLQKIYNLKSKISDGGPTVLTLSRIAMTNPTVVASMLHKFDDNNNKVKRPVTKKMLKKICGADFPSVLMSNIVASLIPKDPRVISKGESQKILNAIALYTGLEAQKTKRSFSEKNIQECVHLNAKYVTLAYKSHFVSEKERQSAFKKPYFKNVYNKGKLSLEVVKIDMYMQKLIDQIKKSDPFFNI